MLRTRWEPPLSASRTTAVLFSAPTLVPALVALFDLFLSNLPRIFRHTILFLIGIMILCEFNFVGMYVANRASDKITQLTDNVYVCRSGSVRFNTSA